MESINVDDEIAIRPVSASDADGLFEIVDANRAYLARWLPWVDSIRTVEDERRWVGRMADQDGHDREQPYAIVYKGAVVGAIGITVEPLNRSGEIGYWIAEDMQGHGIVTRACRALVDHAFRSQELHRLFIRPATENRRSRAIPERLRFVPEGTQRQALCVSGKFYDAAVYSMLAPEWTGRDP